MGVASMKRWTIGCLVALVLGVVLGAYGQEQPQVIQPGAAGYSASQRAALDEAIRGLERVLANPDFASRRSLGQNGWDGLDFAAYTAGSLERIGYRTVIVRRDDGTSAGRVWVLVGLDLYGTTAWVPVEPLPNSSRPQSTLGVVAKSGGASLGFDAQYVGYDSIVELPPNMPPIAIIRPPVRVLERVSTAFFGHTSVDHDGEIVLYEWTFPATAPETSISSSIWFTFPALGTYAVTLTVTDSRGAQASTTMSVEVVEENTCGCGG